MPLTRRKSEPWRFLAVSSVPSEQGAVRASGTSERTGSMPSLKLFRVPLILTIGATLFLLASPLLRAQTAKQKPRASAGAAASTGLPEQRTARAYEAALTLSQCVL